ncbi:MAG TPA: hypothetical protein VGE34_04810 [Candidatus Saccharimonadales bacterium]
MVKAIQEKHHKKSKLELLSLSFEANRTIAQERRFTKQRTHDNE